MQLLIIWCHLHTSRVNDYGLVQSIKEQKIQRHEKHMMTKQSVMYVKFDSKHIFLAVSTNYDFNTF